MAERKLSICVFVDALGWRLVEHHGFLGDLLPVRSPLATVFGYSSTCDPTILTGLPPRAHGHFSFFVYDPPHSPFRALPWLRWLRYLPDPLGSRGRVRHRLSRMAQRQLGYTGYFQLYNVPFEHLHLFDYTEKRDLYMPGGIINGQATVFDRLRAAEVPFFLTDWRLGEAANLAAAEAALAEGQVRFAYVYLAAMDAVLHAIGPEGPDVAAHLASYEQRLRKLVAAARARYDDVRLFVFSDHGMTEVSALCDVAKRLSATGLVFGRDFAAVYDATMARFWFLAPGAKDAIVSALAAEPLGAIVTDEELAAWGCDFPDRRYGELFFLLRPGVLLCPGFMAVRPLAGMHGYDPDHPDSVASFLASHAPDPMPRGLADLYGLMCREAGFAP